MLSLSASDKLVLSATRLFYARGITASGVDTIVAEAGVSKPTLYAHFRTKQHLIAAVLERQHQQRRASLEAHLQDRQALSAPKRLLSIFDWIAAHQRGEWARGCPFVNASVELTGAEDVAAHNVIRRHKRWFRGVLTALSKEAGVASPAALSSQLHLLIEGANARMLAETDHAAIADAKRAAGVLIADAQRSRRIARPRRATRNDC